MTETAIDISGLRFSYDEVPVLNIDQWTLPAGTSFFLRGASGSGKSTLLNIVCGLLQPSCGTVKVGGTGINRLRSHARDRFRAQHIGVIFQQFNLLPYLSVLDNLRLARHFGKAPECLEPAFLFERLQLPPVLFQRPAGSLSVGQQQRVAIARALINRPALLIADEPTSALDADTRDTFIELLLELAKEGRATVLFVSHDASLARHFDASEDLSRINRLHDAGEYHAA